MFFCVLLILLVWAIVWAEGWFPQSAQWNLSLSVAVPLASAGAHPLG